MYFINLFNYQLGITNLGNLYYNFIDYFDGFEFLYIFITLYGFLYLSLYLIFKDQPEFIILNANKKLYVLKNMLFVVF